MEIKKIGVAVVAVKLVVSVVALAAFASDQDKAIADAVRKEKLANLTRVAERAKRNADYFRSILPDVVKAQSPAHCLTAIGNPYWAIQYAAQDIMDEARSKKTILSNVNRLVLIESTESATRALKTFDTYCESLSKSGFVAQDDLDNLKAAIGKASSNIEMANGILKSEAGK